MPSIIVTHWVPFSFPPHWGGTIQHADELIFAVFCVENVTKSPGVDGRQAYDALTEKSDFLQNYIMPCYDILHTLGND